MTCGQVGKHPIVIFIVVDIKLIGKGIGLSSGHVTFKVTSLMALLILVVFFFFLGIIQRRY